MAAYVTSAQMVTRFGTNELARVADIDGDGTPDPTVIAAAIQDASDYADGFIGSRYTLPLATAPSILQGIVADLARERLFTLQPTDEITNRAERARSDLKLIAAGTIVLPLASGGAVDEGSGDEPAFDPCARSVFDDCDLGSYRGWLQ